MKNNTKLIKAAAVAAALLPATSFAAVDDQGMQYVSGAEGLSGSLRVFILESEDTDGLPTDRNELGKEDSLRLYYQGNADLGGGLSSTYYWELRNGDDGINVHAYDIGLEGAFGSFEVGKLGMTSLRMVPGGSLDTIYGNSRSTFAADPGDNGIRFESPSISGFKAGVSAIGASNADEDDWADAFSFGVKYEMPIGLWVGLGYDSQTYRPSGTANVDADYDDLSGFNAGARYGQDNWTVTYEYRTYDGLSPYAAADDAASLAAGGTSLAAGTSLYPVTRGGGLKTQKYLVHGLGARVNFDRITASANYSIETQENSSAAANVDLDRTTFAADIVYALGSRAMIGAGIHTQETERYDVASNNVVNLTALGTAAETTKFGVYYRVDF